MKEFLHRHTKLTKDEQADWQELADQVERLMDRKRLRQRVKLKLEERRRNDS